MNRGNDVDKNSQQRVIMKTYNLEFPVKIALVDQSGTVVKCRMEFESQGKIAKISINK